MNKYCKLPKSKDRRIKLTKTQKMEIRKKYKPFIYSYNTLAKEYNVSKRTIIFIVNPSKYATAREQFKQRRKDGRYKPTKEQWRSIMSEHRAYRRKQGLKN